MWSLASHSALLSCFVWSQQEEECDAQKARCKEVEEERTRLQKQQATMQQQAEKQKRLIDEGRERFERAEAENANLSKVLFNKSYRTCCILYTVLVHRLSCIRICTVDVHKHTLLHLYVRVMYVRL